MDSAEMIIDEQPDDRMIRAIKKKKKKKKKKIIDEIMCDFSGDLKRKMLEKFGETVKCRRCLKTISTEEYYSQITIDSFLTLEVKCPNCLKITAFNSRINQREIQRGKDLIKIANVTTFDIVSGPKSIIDSLPETINLHDYNFVYFHLETSGFRDTADILQIDAKFGERTFNVYVNSTQPVDPQASEVTGFKNILGTLFQHDQEIRTIPVKDALISFQEFLNLSSKPCVLIAHNRAFHIGIFLRAVINNSMINCFTKIAGFSDSCVLFRRLFPERKGKGMFTLARLAEDFLKGMPPNGDFHEALYEVTILEKLVSSYIKAKDLIADCKRYKELMMERLFIPHLALLGECVSPPIVKKLALAGITYEALQNIHRMQGEDGIVGLLSRKGDDGKPIVTKDKKVTQKIIAVLKENSTI